MGAKMLSAVLVLGMACGLTANPRQKQPLAEPAFVPGEVIVAYKNVPAKQEFACTKDCVVNTVSWRKLGHAPFAKGKPGTSHPLARVRVVKLQPGEDVLEAAEKLSQLPSVAYAHPNYIMTAAFSPDDTFFSTEQYGPQIIRLPEAWDLTVGRSDVIVAVADSGYRLDHEEFVNGRIWDNDDPPNGIDDDGNGYVDDFRGYDMINDDNEPVAAGISGNHGTHVMGIVAAGTNNNKGIAGVAQCTIMPIQVFNGLNGTWAAFAEGIHYAVDNGARVINFSGGGFGGTGLLEDAVEYAYDNNVVVVGAVGNNNASTAYYPAAYPGAIAVSATGELDAYYDLSNFGNYVDVAAPGIGIYSTLATSTTAYGFDTGTSMAAPHVTGLVALMLSIDPFLTVEDVRSLLRDNAVDLGDPGFDILFGAGRIDARATLDAVASESAPPTIVHDGISTFPPSGFIDPLGESSNGSTLDLGIDTIDIAFNKPVRDVGENEGGGLTIDAFSVVASESGTPPTVIALQTDNNMNVTLTLSSKLPVGEWTTVVADVEDFAGVRISHPGDLGVDDEVDRVDIGFLPADVDQNGIVGPLDLFRFRQYVVGTATPAYGSNADYIDTDRSGVINPLDLLRFRNLVNGGGNATQPWSNVELADRP